MRKIYIFVLALNLAVIYAHKEFTPEGCLAMHNELRGLHESTEDLIYDKELEKTAKDSTDFLAFGDAGIDVRPTRPLPKRRKRRHVDDDIDENRHIESWDGEIFYPDSTIPKSYGESIHKMCCTSAPHCPKEFFHNLLFPPSAEGVVNDFYREEIDSYDFASGQKKTQFYTQIKHFTNIVWKKTKKIGCAQSEMSNKNCVYTVIHYEVEGSVGTTDDFKQNVGDLIATSESSKVLMIFLIVFFIVLLISLIVLCCCCREKIKEKYYEIKIKTDTMKAEQELETDSTAFWWLKVFKVKRKTQKRPTRTRSSKHHQSLRDTNVSIEVVHTARPQRSFKQPPRVRGQSNAQSFAIMYQGISQKPTKYKEDEQIYENFSRGPPPTRQQSEDIYENSSYHNKPPPPTTPTGHKAVTREPSFSGKPPPPPVPVPQQRPIAPMKPPVQQTESWGQKKPSPSDRPKVTKPMVPPPSAPASAPRPNPRPTPVARKQEPENLNQGGAAKASPPVKTKPMMPPSHRPR